MHSHSSYFQTSARRDRSRRHAELAGTIMIRRSRRDDLSALQRLAELDSRVLPAGSFLLAEIGDELVAAAPLDVDEEPVSNPFKRTADIRELLWRSARRTRREATPDVAA